MKIQTLTAVLIMAGLLYSCGTPDPSNSVEDVVELFELSVNQKELSPLNEFFSSTAKIYEQGNVDESWEKYRDGHLGKEIEDMDPLNFNIEINEYLRGAQMTLARGEYLVEGKLNNNKINSSGLITISLKIENGKWKINHLQFSRKCNTSPHEHSTAAEKPEKKVLSPKTAAMANIGDAHIHIDYSSPRVRGRQIYGGLVAYDEVWAAGAHRATVINFPTEVVIDGTSIPAGKYGFFTIPGKNQWTLIINKAWDQHMADDYEPKEDLIRIEVRPETLDEVQEELLYTIKKTGEHTGRVSLAWGKVKVGFDFKVKQ